MRSQCDDVRTETQQRFPCLFDAERYRSAIRRLCAARVEQIRERSTLVVGSLRKVGFENEPPLKIESRVELACEALIAGVEHGTIDVLVEISTSASDTPFTATVRAKAFVPDAGVVMAQLQPAIGRVEAISAALDAIALDLHELARLEQKLEEFAVHREKYLSEREEQRAARRNIESDPSNRNEARRIEGTLERIEAAISALDQKSADRARKCASSREVIFRLALALSESDPTPLSGTAGTLELEVAELLTHSREETYSRVDADAVLQYENALELRRRIRRAVVIGAAALFVGSACWFLMSQKPLLAPLVGREPGVNVSGRLDDLRPLARARRDLLAMPFLRSTLPQAEELVSRARDLHELTEMANALVSEAWNAPDVQELRRVTFDQGSTIDAKVEGEGVTFQAAVNTVSSARSVFGTEAVVWLRVIGDRTAESPSLNDCTPKIHLSRHVFCDREIRVELVVFVDLGEGDATLIIPLRRGPVGGPRIASPELRRVACPELFQ
jgi:hypothetical protein